MGILTKFLAGEKKPKTDISENGKKNHTGEKNTKSTPRPPADFLCDRCPAGCVQHHWRDAYQNWHCAFCQPPRVDAMVRESRIIDPITLADGAGAPNGSAGQAVDQWPLGAGLQILSIRWPDGTWDLPPGTTQAQRRAEIVAFEKYGF